MKITCINNTNLEHFITIGKLYEADWAEEDETYWIFTDSGESFELSKTRFTDTDENYMMPCPFCGNKKPRIATDTEIEMSDLKLTGYFAVNCNCNSGGCGAVGGYKQFESKAIELWNRRT